MIVVIVAVVVVVAVVVAVAVGLGGDWTVHLYFCCVLGKYIILMCRKYYFNV